MDMKTAVIYRLEELIRQKDITVNEAAIRSGVPPSTLKNILYRENIMCFVGCCDFTYIRVGTNRY